MTQQWEKRLALDFENKSPLSRTTYASVMRKFSPKEWSKWEVLSFLKELKDRNYSSSYRRFCYYVIKKRFELEEKPWPFNSARGNVPVVDVSELNTPVLDSKSIAQMVAWAKDCQDIQIQALISLFTIYGLRRTEIVRIEKDDIERDSEGDWLILVKTAKGGERRKHLVPKEIVDLLQEYSFPSLSLAWLSQLFNKICRWSGIAKNKRQGWHSIRRSLATELEMKAPLMLVWDFLRWKKSALASTMGLSPMLGTYFHKEPKEIDREIFKIHPFLPFWRA